MIWLLSALSCSGFAAITALALGAPRLGWGRYWPPEQVPGWQHRSFRLLFRLGLYPLLIASAILARESAAGWPYMGAPLVAVGFGAALLFTGRLGWRQAFGAPEGLVTTGAYGYSRNPVYVATWVGLLGWALCLPHPGIITPLAIWALLYLIAPRLEEPWLETEFGQDYLSYKAQVPRFFGP